MTNRNNNKAARFALAALVLLGASFTAFWTLSVRPLGNHESLVSVTAREMLERSDWVWPTFNDQPRLVKTPLSYWLVAGLAKLTGRVDELTARLPSAALAALSVAAVLYFLSILISFRVAAISACVWATSLFYIRYSHNARPEMALTFFISLCLLSFYAAITAQSRKRQIVFMVVFWVSLGLGMLAKGPVPLPVVGLPVVLYLSIKRQWKLVPKLLPVIGALIFLAIVLPWPLAIMHKLGWDPSVWKREFVDRFFGEYASGHKPFWYYLPRMFGFVAPWSAFLPMALVAPFYKVWGKKRPIMLYLWLWFVAGLVFFTANGCKRQHYILPLMPAMAMLIGILLEDMAFTRRAFTSGFARKVLAGHTVVAILAVPAVPVAVWMVGRSGPISIMKSNGYILAHATALTTTMAAVLVAATVAFARKRPGCGCGVIFGGIIGVTMAAFVLLLNPLDTQVFGRDFALKARKIVPGSDEAVAFRYIAARSVHYFGRAVPVVDDIDELYDRYQSGAWVVAFGEYVEQIDGEGRFRKVWFTENAEYRRDRQTPGALYHSSAPIIPPGTTDVITGPR